MDLAALDSDFAEGQPSMTAEERLRSINDTIAEVRPFVQADGGDIELVGVEGRRRCRLPTIVGAALFRARHPVKARPFTTFGRPATNHRHRPPS